MTFRHTLDSRAEDLIKDFTLSQLRELVGTISLGRETGSLSSKNRQQLIDLVGRIGDSNKKALVAHRLEAITPYKHLYLYAPATAIRYEAFASDCRKRFGSLVDNFSPLPRDTASELHLQLCLLDSQNQRIFLKFAHQITTWETVASSANERTQRKVKKRHPVVVAFYCSLTLIVISFPGFTQGAVDFKERATYAGLAKTAARLFTAQSGVETTGFQAKIAIEKLLADPDAGVVDVKRTLKPVGGGRIVVDSWGDEGGLAQYFSQVLSHQGKTSVDSKVAQKLLQEAQADDIWLMWKKLEFWTRVGFQESAPDVMIVWREAGPDLGKLEIALRALVSHLAASMPTDTLAAIEDIDRTPVGTVVTPSALAQRHNLRLEEALRLLLNAASQNRVQLRFRVKTDAVLLEFANQWRSSLIEFPKVVHDENDNPLDLSDRSNIEVAFERVG
jgi:hypothetical protein